MGKTAVASSFRTADIAGVPLVKVLTEDGSALLPGRHGPLPSNEQMLAIHRAMLTTRLSDDRFLKLQRQGRIGFVGTSMGLEAAIHGSGAVFGAKDWIFPALRENGVAVQRGAPLHELVAQMYGNAEDTAKGRQMPNHFQSRPANFVSWSSVIGTQLPQAVGAAMAFQSRREPHIACAYSGDGATSSSGFHSALNCAAVFKAPVVFVVIDNAWAISVPSSKQTAARSYGAKAVAYGMPGVDVDGNDALACYQETRTAAERARAGQGPSLVCLRSYRMGGHSSSDDPTRYRNAEEFEYWKGRDPLTRFENYLRSQNLLDEASRQQLADAITAELSAAVERAEKAGPPTLETLVEDVYASPPASLRRQVIDALRITAEKGEAERVAGEFPL
ncbi:MAG: thiamine pyrophosphate-dependent dehydrogenase E1 component subunit alpha [Planctomycetota bacterium]|nr:MAG: thiamine pyrophosphate-dependent dehydrogenase E1 component subunit alpha [Planctomycetota bacterium]